MSFRKTSASHRLFLQRIQDEGPKPRSLFDHSAAGHQTVLERKRWRVGSNGWLRVTKRTISQQAGDRQISKLFFSVIWRTLGASAYQPTADFRLPIRCRCGLIGFEFFQLQLKLFDLPFHLLRVPAELHRSQLSDQQLQPFDLLLCESSSACCKQIMAFSAAGSRVSRSGNRKGISRMPVVCHVPRCKKNAQKCVNARESHT